MGKFFFYNFKFFLFIKFRRKTLFGKKHPDAECQNRVNKYPAKQNRVQSLTRWAGHVRLGREEAGRCGPPTNHLWAHPRSSPLHFSSTREVSSLDHTWRATIGWILEDRASPTWVGEKIATVWSWTWGPPPDCVVVIWGIYPILFLFHF